MKKAIEQNEIGNVRHIYARRNSNNVRVSRVLGKTSLAFWLTPHDIDMIQGIVPDRIKKVFVSTRDKAKTNDDFIIAHLIFEGGVSAVLEISWCGPPVSGMSREAIFEVRGNRGNLEVADYDMNIRIFKGDQKVFVEDTYEDFKLYEQYRGYFFDLIDDYIRRIRIGKPNKNELKQVLETTRICEMIRISIEEERIVDSLEVS
jgi:predicted dehydrogenase